MGIHATTQFRHSLERKIVDLWGEFTPVATAIACTLDAPKNKGLISITRTDVGAYTILTNDGTYNRLVDINVVCMAATGDPVAPSWFLVSRGVDATTGFQKVAIQFNAADGTTAADPAVTETVLVHLSYADSAV